MSLPGFLSPLFLLPCVQNQLCGGEAGFKRSFLFSIFPLLRNRLFFFLNLRHLFVREISYHSMHPTPGFHDTFILVFVTCVQVHFCCLMQRGYV